MSRTKSQVLPAGPVTHTHDVTRPESIVRRKLLQRAAPAAIITFASAPVMANTCFTSSASTSLHPSGMARHIQNSSFNCAGLSPAQWGDQPTNNWPRHAYKHDDKFNSTFGPPNLQRNNNLDPTLRQVLRNTAWDKVARACVATALNVASHKVDARILADRPLKSIWQSVGNGGLFEPYRNAPAHLHWNADKVYAWLALTWGEVDHLFFPELSG